MGMQKVEREGIHAVVTLDERGIHQALVDAVTAQFPELRGPFKTQVNWTNGKEPIAAHVELFVESVKKG